MDGQCQVRIYSGTGKFLEQLGLVAGWREAHRVRFGNFMDDKQSDSQQGRTSRTPYPSDTCRAVLSLWLWTLFFSFRVQIFAQADCRMLYDNRRNSILFFPYGQVIEPRTERGQSFLSGRFWTSWWILRIVQGAVQKTGTVYHRCHDSCKCRERNDAPRTCQQDRIGG